MPASIDDSLKRETDGPEQRLWPGRMLSPTVVFAFDTSRGLQQPDAAAANVMELEYDWEGQLLNALITPQGGSPAKGFTYTYDAMGNRTSEQRDTLSGEGPFGPSQFMETGPWRPEITQMHVPPQPRAPKK